MSDTPKPPAWLEDSAGDLEPLPEETPTPGTRCPAAHLPVNVVKAAMSRAEGGALPPLTLCYPLPDGSWRMLVFGADGQIKHRLPFATGAQPVGVAAAGAFPAEHVDRDALAAALAEYAQRPAETPERVGAWAAPTPVGLPAARPPLNEPEPASAHCTDWAMSPEAAALWEAVNAYVAACGGDPGGPPTSARMGAVVGVESAVTSAVVRTFWKVARQAPQPDPRPDPTLDRLDRIQRRHRRATRGPWKYRPESTPGAPAPDTTVALFGAASVVTTGSRPLRPRSNLRFIAAARRDVPWLERLARRLLGLARESETARAKWMAQAQRDRQRLHAIEQLVGAAERRHAGGDPPPRDLVARVDQLLERHHSATAVIDGVLSDLDGQLTEASFPHAEGGSLGDRLRAALRVVDGPRVRRLLQKVRGAFLDAVANAPTDALGEQRRAAMADLEAFLLAPAPADLETIWQRFLADCGYTQPVERVSMSWVIELAKARQALAAVLAAAPPTAAALVGAIDAAERAYLAFHLWKLAPTGHPDFWLDPTDATPWPRSSAIAIQRDRDGLPPPAPVFRRKDERPAAVEVPVLPEACACYAQLADAPEGGPCTTCGRAEAEHRAPPEAE